jgi:hypothetical protein
MSHIKRQPLVSTTTTKSFDDSSSDSSTSYYSKHTVRPGQEIKQKERNPNKNIINPADSLSYSSSESSKNSITSTDTQYLILRPSSTIKSKTVPKNQKQQAPKLNQDWKNFFQVSMEKKSITSNSSATGNKATLVQTKIFNPESFQKDNLPFGDNVHHDNEIKGFLFHNINGIKDEYNWTQINLTMAELNISCFGLAEINTTL